ncbi:unnamed protein product [Rotaria sp. Silwood1]|nr:unnamed protein product [Rotaria sp. Silwood1]CAF0949097.1 unnamed protein product [Rotaria sp. Silwood1]CAF3384878.1 unnamed protein product [Rotaria sp. Silwood1]
MTDQYVVSMIDTTRKVSFDNNTLLTSSTINALHFPGLTISGRLDTGGSRPTSFLSDNIGMCESMTESFSSAGGQDETILINQTNIHQSDISITNDNLKVERKDSIAQKKRRSRKSQYDASIDTTLALDKIESVNLFDEQNEADDAWLYEIPKTKHKNDSTTDNIFSWVHKEFKSNDIQASKHRLLCKLDDMSNARTIRSLSCHNFVDNQRTDNVKRSLTEQQVNSEPVKSGRLNSPLRAISPLLKENVHTRSISPVHLSPRRANIIITHANEKNPNHTTGKTRIRSRDTSREPEREPLDYTDLEDRPGTKPPVAPKSTITRNGVKPNNNRASTIQTNTTTKTNGYDVSTVTQSKSSVTSTTRASVLPPNSANNNRTRPSTNRPIQAYRGSQTSYNNNANNNPKVQVTTSSSIQRNSKKPPNSFGSTFTTKEFISNENGLLTDVSNKPLIAPTRSQTGPQRRTILPHSSTYSSVERIPSSSSSMNITTSRQTILPRSSSSTLSQGRKSGIPTVGKQQKSTTTTVTRPTSSNVNSSTKSSDSMMVTRTVRGQKSIARPQISPWNDGCY